VVVVLLLQLSATGDKLGHKMRDKMDLLKKNYFLHPNNFKLLNKRKGNSINVKFFQICNFH
jgi:hypothetical protein